VTACAGAATVVAAMAARMSLDRRMIPSDRSFLLVPGVPRQRAVRGPYHTPSGDEHGGFEHKLAAGGVHHATNDGADRP
jgi:hypothetical protein